MSSTLKIILLALCFGFANPATGADSRSMVVQLRPLGAPTSDSLHAGTSEAFKKATDENCWKGARGFVGPWTGALLGVFIDWMFDKATTNLSSRFEKRLAEYSETYSSRPTFADMFHEDFWTEANSTGKTCVAFQRVKCSDGECTSGTVGLSAGFMLEREKTHLRLVPYALELSRPAARHAGGVYTVATRLTIAAPQVDEKHGGSMWSSPSVQLASHVCTVNNSGVAATEGECFKPYVTDDKAWASAVILPLPPRSVHAFVVAVAEVGEPTRGLRGLADFLNSSQGELSDVLSTALKERLEVTTE